MSVILAQWVLKPAFLPVDRLCPLSVSLATKYPAFVILSLDYKDPELGHVDMINLGCTTIVGYRDIVKRNVDRWCQSSVSFLLYQLFTKPALH